MAQTALLDVKNLRTEFHVARDKSVAAVDGVSFSVNTGEIIGLVGESGCGKSVTSLSIMQLLRNTTGRVTGGEVILEGRDLLLCGEKDLRQIRGRSIAMIFQEPMSSLNPVMRVEDQMLEALLLHINITREEAKKRIVEMLSRVGIANPELIARSFPHQMSGGMSQRVMIAMAMSCNPHLLIADEPTTALDVTIQAQILELMRKIRAEYNTSIILITHDLGIVAEMCSRVLVMYAGRIVEEAPVKDLFAAPQHPYTVGLLESVPKIGSGVDSLPFIPGTVPDLASMPAGCKFAPRCKHASDRCRSQEPDLFKLGDGKSSRCWLMEKNN